MTARAPRQQHICPICKTRIRQSGDDWISLSAVRHHVGCARATGLIGTRRMGAPRTATGGAAVQFMVRLPEPKAAALRAHAQRNGMTTPDIIRDALERAGLLTP